MRHLTLRVHRTRLFGLNVAQIGMAWWVDVRVSRVFMITERLNKCKRFSLGFLFLAPR